MLFLTIDSICGGTSIRGPGNMPNTEHGIRILGCASEATKSDSPLYTLTTRTLTSFLNIVTQLYLKTE